MESATFTNNSFPCSHLGLIHLDYKIGNGASQHGLTLVKHIKVITTWGVSLLL